MFIREICEDYKTLSEKKTVKCELDSLTRFAGPAKYTEVFNY